MGTDSELFRLRNLHPGVRIGTASDSYAGGNAPGIAERIARLFSTRTQ